MNHSLFAGFFCTAATIFLFIEIYFYKIQNIPKLFFLLYGGSCIIWILFSIQTEQMLLFLISSLQLFSVIFGYFLQKINKDLN